MTLRVTCMRDWLRLACAVVLLSLGFAHKPVVAEGNVFSVSSRAFDSGAFAGQLCIGDSTQDAPALPGWHACDACLVASAAMLPPPPADHFAAPTSAFAVDFPAGAGVPSDPAFRAGYPVRGPPALFV